MKKITKFIVIAILGILPFSFVGAVSAPKLPMDKLGSIPKEKIIKMLCYKTKYEARELEASLRALDEILSENMSQYNKILSITNTDPYLLKIREIKRIVFSLIENKICQATEVASALNGINELQNLSIYDDIKNGQDAFKARIKGKINQKVSSLKKQIKQKLQAEVNILKINKEKELRQLAEKLKKEKRQEYKKRIGVLTKKAYDGSFGTDAKIVRAKIKKMIKDDVKLYEKSMIKKLEIEKKRYEKEARLELQKKGEKIAFEKKKELESLRSMFLGIQNKIMGKINVYKAEYQPFQLKYITLKKEILKVIIVEQIDKAEESVRGVSDKINLAIKNGVKVDSVEKIIAKLEINKKEFISAIEKNISDEDLFKQVNTLKNKWEGIQNELMLVFKKQTSEIKKQVQDAVYKKGVFVALQENVTNLKPLIVYWEKTILCKSSKQTYECRHKVEVQSLIDKSIRTKNKIDNIFKELNNFGRLPDTTKVEETMSKAKNIRIMLLDIKKSLAEVYQLQKKLIKNIRS